MVFSTHAIHVPLHPPNNFASQFSFINQSSRANYSAMVHHVDSQVKEIIDALKVKGMWDNTLILFFPIMADQSM